MALPHFVRDYWVVMAELNGLGIGWRAHLAPHQDLHQRAAYAALAAEINLGLHAAINLARAVC